MSVPGSLRSIATLNTPRFHNFVVLSHSTVSGTFNNRMAVPGVVKQLREVITIAVMRGTNP